MLHRFTLLFAFILALSTTSLTRLCAQQAYTLTDLAPWASGSNEKTIGLNAAGQVTGTVLDNTGARRAYLWTPNFGDRTRGTLVLLPLPKDATASYGSAVNSAGQVVGTSSTPGKKGSSTLSAVRWGSNGVPTSLTPSGGRGYGINAFGQVTGNALFSGYTYSHAFLASNGSLIDIGVSLSGAYPSQGWDINRDGWVVGMVSGPGAVTAFVWKPNTPNGTVGSATLLPLEIATAVNDAGQIVGSGNNGHAVLYSTATGLMDLGLSVGFDGSGAAGLNNVGQIVGWQSNWTFGFEHAFLWESANGMRDLNDAALFAFYAPNGSLLSGWVLEDAIGINDFGQIVGVGYNPAGQRRAFLLTPR